MANAGAVDPGEAAEAIAIFGTAAAALHTAGGYLTTAAQFATKAVPYAGLVALDLSLLYGLEVETKAVVNGQCQP
jgi:hypothetical protein